MSSRAPLCSRLAAFAAAVALASPASAAVVLQSAVQGSAASTDVLDTTAFTVGNGTEQVMIIAVSSSGTSTGSRVTFRGVAAKLFFSQDNAQPGSLCRTELWRIVDPPVGSGFVSVTMTPATSFGVGVLLYSGVDQKSPTEIIGVDGGTSSNIRITTSLPDNRPLVGVACLGGNWAMRAGPDAVAGPGDLTLWDFTEKNVVGLGGQQTTAGNATVSWNVSFGSPFPWASVGLTITPSGLAAPLPDAGPDVAPDAGPDLAPGVGPDLAPDVGPDLAPDTRPASDPPPLSPDAAPDLSLPPRDAGVDTFPEVPDPEVDAGVIAPGQEAGVGAESEDAGPAPLPADGDSPGADEAGGTTVRDVNLEVGCACRLGGPARPGLLPVLVLGLFALRRRR